MFMLPKDLFASSLSHVHLYPFPHHLFKDILVLAWWTREALPFINCKTYNLVPDNLQSSEILMLFPPLTDERNRFLFLRGESPNEGVVELGMVRRSWVQKQNIGMESRITVLMIVWWYKKWNWRKFRADIWLRSAVSFVPNHLFSNRA